jgi:sugar diacid utilization regulator
VASPKATKRDALAELVERLQARLDDLVADGLAAMQGEVPAYAGIEDPAFVADVRFSMTRHSSILMHCLKTRSSPTPEDFQFVRNNAADRAARDIPLADFLHAFRVFNRILMDAILRESRPRAGGDPALEAARGLLEYADLATTYASDAYLQAQQSLLADNDRIHRDLLEDLLAGREPGSGSRLAAANAAGLTPRSPCVVITAVPVDAVDDAHALRHAASSTARAVRGGVAPLVVIRQREIVIVRALDEPRSTGMAKPLERIQAKLAAEGVGLAIGVSTTLDGIGRLSDGYREAYVAVHSIGPGGGVVCLEDLSPFDYLALRSDATAQRLVSPAIVDFLADDARKGGALTRTLLAYVDADLNVSSAAEQLFIHPNTAHYRLARIAEKTGLDLRNVSHLMGLLIAVKLAHEPSTGGLPH